MSENMAEWSSEEWRTSVELQSRNLVESEESEGMREQEKLDGKEAVKKEVEGDKEATML